MDKLLAARMKADLLLHEMLLVAIIRSMDDRSAVLEVLREEHQRVFAGLPADEAMDTLTATFRESQARIRAALGDLPRTEPH